MYKILFTTKANRTVESVNEAFLRETGLDDWGYETMEDIERAEREGFLEFDGENLTVFADM